MIMKNSKAIEAVYKGSTEIGSIYKGADLLFENYVDKVVSGTNSISLNNAKANSLEYLKLYGGCKQKNSELPVSYTKIDYIETNGNCWIEIPIVPDENTEFEVTASHITSPACQLMITQQSITNNYFNIGKATATQKVISRCGSQTLTSSIDGVDKFTAIANRSSFYVNGTKVGDFTAETINGLGNVDIFRGVYGANTYYTSAEARVHEVIIRNNGTEVFHGYPAKNSANTIGLYDTVSGTFLTNKGSGSLIAGEVLTPSPGNIMPIVCNNGELKIRHQSGLPLEYKRVEYIQSNMAIDLGAKTNQNTELVTKFKKLVNSPSAYLYSSDSGSSITTNTTAYLSTSGYWRFDSKFIAVSLDTNVDIISIQNKDGVWINNNNIGTYTDISEFTSVNNLKAFSSVSTPQIQIDYIQMKQYNSNVVEHNWVACKRYDNVYGLYDTVNDIFYTNSEATITGGNIIDNIEIYTNGTTETVDVNYFIKSNMVITKTGIRTSATETIPLGGTQSNNGYNCSTYIKVLPNTQYTTILPKASTITTLGLVFFSNTTVESAISGVSLSAQGSASYTFTTPINCNYIRFTWSNTQGNDVKLIKTGNIATAQNLFGVDTYKDIQEILTGNITRNAGIVVLDGTEDWQDTPVTGIFRGHNILNNYSSKTAQNIACICTHYVGIAPIVSGDNMTDKSIKCGLTDGVSSNYSYLYIKDLSFTTAGQLQAYLAQQYVAGTPVIVVFPQTTATTETTTGQNLNIQKGNNIISISQASLSQLELEAKYKGK